MAAFVGVPIVARELERGTSRLAWSLAPSRWRWYFARVAPALLAVAVLGLLAGHALDRLLAATEPGLDVSATFVGFGFRGVVLASRMLFLFCLAVAIGAILGRTLPAVILTAIVAFVGIGAGSDLHRQMLAAEAVPVSEEAWGEGFAYLFIEQRFQLPDGTLVGWDYFSDGEPYDSEGNAYPQFMMAVPGERYRFAETVQATRCRLRGGAAPGRLRRRAPTTRVGLGDLQLPLTDEPRWLSASERRHAVRSGSKRGSLWATPPRSVDAPFVELHDRHSTAQLVMSNGAPPAASGTT
jgi:hypothetical protein